MTPTEALLQRRASVVARGVPMATRIAIDRGEGGVLVDLEGRELLDWSSGIGVTTLGHADPHVVQAIAEQAGRLQHVCMHIATYEGYVAVCEVMARLVPHGEHTKALLLNSGAEAVENAVKIARQATGRQAVMAYTGAFHGRTLLGMSLTSKVGYKRGCGPFATGIHRLPYPGPCRAEDPDDVAERELRRLRRALQDTVAPEDLAAILIEPVLGEGGFIPAPVAYLQGLRALCDEHGILLIFDEVQSGLCRTGGWAAHQVLGVSPDLSTWAKALGGGLPLAAVLGRAEVVDAALPGTLGGTFGGNPVACAAALATLARMEELNLCERAVALGKRLRERFEGLRARHREVVDVRGLGAMMGLELGWEGDPLRPATSATTRIRSLCEEAGLLLLSAGIDGNVLRALPPLIASDEQLDRALDILDSAFAQVLA